MAGGLLPYRMACGVALLVPALAGLAWASWGVQQTTAALPDVRDGRTARAHADLPSAADGERDFDFEIGTWKTHVRRRLRPLTGSTEWIDLNGTSIVRKVWGGRANLVELEADGPTGHFQALSLRLYNPQSRQWSLHFSNSAGGTLSPPTIGQFTNGRGEFYSQESLNGRAIFVRFVITVITPDSCRFEQAFSADGGKTWEVNWVATDTRMKE